MIDCCYIFIIWALGKQGENLLSSFEKTFLWKIFVPVLENGFWRRRRNSEIFKLIDEHDVKFINLDM
jgi:hypothetical protein